MKSITFFIKRLKMKFFFGADSFDASNASPDIVKAANALTKHYNLEQQNVNTSAGTGNIYTPITHHNNDYVDPNLIGKHLVEDH